MLFMFVVWMKIDERCLMKMVTGCAICVEQFWIKRAVYLAACVLIAWKIGLSKFNLKEGKDLDLFSFSNCKYRC